jgi:putative nucleotidyltransferase with HDIG domain
MVIRAVYNQYQENEQKVMPTTTSTTLRSKIALFITVLLLVTAGIFSYLTVQTMNSRITDEVTKRAEALCKSTAALAPYSMLSGDVLGMDNIVAKVKGANPDVDYVALANTDMLTLAHTRVEERGKYLTLSPGELIRLNDDGTMIFRAENTPGLLLEIMTPVVYKNIQMGNVVIGINSTMLHAARTETRKRIFMGFAIVMLLGAGCIIILSSVVARPIKELSLGVQELKAGRRTKLRVYAHDELGQLTTSFNQMTEQITHQQDKLSAYAAELEDAYVSTVKVLSAAIDARDPYTLGHSTRVAKFARKIGEAFGFSHEELEDLEVASLFHDVGKLKTPDALLHKDGPLDALEHREVAHHSEHGAAILSRAPSLQKYIPAVRHHHEWYDGEGYPDRLRGEDIPLHAAIIAVADAFDAMTSIRPYKNSFSCADALDELARCSGTQFNPLVVAVFHTVIDVQPQQTDPFARRT